MKVTLWSRDGDGGQGAVWEAPLCPGDDGEQPLTSGGVTLTSGVRNGVEQGENKSPESHFGRFSPPTPLFPGEEGIPAFFLSFLFFSLLPVPTFYFPSKMNSDVRSGATPYSSLYHPFPSTSSSSIWALVLFWTVSPQNSSAGWGVHT